MMPPPRCNQSVRLKDFKDAFTPGKGGVFSLWTGEDPGHPDLSVWNPAGWEAPERGFELLQTAALSILDEFNHRLGESAVSLGSTKDLACCEVWLMYTFKL